MKKILIFLIIAALFGMANILVLNEATAAPTLTPDVKNTLFFQNVEVIYRTTDRCNEIGGCLDFDATNDPVGYQRIISDGVFPNQVTVGDVIAGIFNVQNIQKDPGIVIWAQDINGDQLSGYFAQTVQAILPNDPGPNIEHLTLVSGTDPWGILQPGEMYRIYVDDGAGFTAYKTSGSIPDDIAAATNGTLWASVTETNGYQYGHIDIELALANFSDQKSFAGIDLVINNTGFAFLRINDVNENEVGGQCGPDGQTNCEPGAILNDFVGTSELEGNAAFPTGSPWPFASNDPFTFFPVQRECCVEIKKYVSVDEGSTFADANDCIEGEPFNTPTIDVGDKAEYKLVVTNCGDDTLDSVLVDDVLIGINDYEAGPMAPGAVVEITKDNPDIGDLLVKDPVCEQVGVFNNISHVDGTCAVGVPSEVSDDDDACVICEEIVPDECRVTAGGNKDGLTVPCELRPNGNPDRQTCANKGPDTWGGQAGSPPRTDCNWTHHHKPGNHDQFVFHSNNCFDITCSDPGPYCEPARHAPNRQIDFSGIGRFNSKHGDFADLPDGDLCFRVHLEDIGEPGRGGRRNDIDPTACDHCPGTIIGNDPDCTNCTDYYLIKIYDSADYDDAGDNCLGNVIYVNGAPSYDNCDADDDPLLPGYYVRAGNVQLHPDNNGGSTGNEEICYDGIDNDGDGDIDAADSDCTSPENSCDDGLDNDGDGFCDLATSTCTDGSTPGDPDCITCTPTASNEHGPRGSDGFDNDCDGLVDGADPD